MLGSVVRAHPSPPISTRNSRNSRKACVCRGLFCAQPGTGAFGLVKDSYVQKVREPHPCPSCAQTGEHISNTHIPKRSEPAAPTRTDPSPVIGFRRLEVGSMGIVQPTRRNLLQLMAGFPAIAAASAGNAERGGALVASRELGLARGLIHINTASAGPTPNAVLQRAVAAWQEIETDPVRMSY